MKILEQYQFHRVIIEQFVMVVILHISQEVDTTEHLVHHRHMVGSMGGLIMRTNGI